MKYTETRLRHKISGSEHGVSIQVSVGKMMPWREIREAVAEAADRAARDLEDHVSDQQAEADADALKERIDGDQKEFENRWGGPDAVALLDRAERERVQAS